METRTKDVTLLLKTSTTCVMTQASEINKYGKVNIY